MYTQLESTGKLKMQDMLNRIRELEKRREKYRRQPTERISSLAGKTLNNPKTSIDAKSLAGAILFLRKHLKRDYKFLGS